MSTEVESAAGVPKTLPNGPIEGIQYPLKVQYCGECSMPLEFCEYYSNFAKCKEWLEKTLPDMFAQLYTNDGDNGEADGDDEQSKKGRQKRGGKALLKPKKKEVGERFVKLARANRGKKKYVTVVTGLASFGIDLKDASKFFASRFACGSSVTGADEIVIQGDVKDDLWDVIPEKWAEIEEEAIDDIGDIKK
ncbi:PREDICTED: density-regulated protein homolog [Rhagoletis zephyria]|uniref:density-regulated protein homolog n=1 Tax=Rhagoletis zephyria TaxID=28612 RepID=UPI00081180DC|nr:PREDICTED: density-regulated protein homolog [Rhagoletis zephyria]